MDDSRKRPGSRGLASSTRRRRANDEMNVHRMLMICSQWRPSRQALLKPFSLPVLGGAPTRGVVASTGRITAKTSTSAAPNVLGGKYELHEAAMSGELEKVKAMLEASPNGVNLRGPKNRTPLHCAAKGDHREVAAYLISVGANTESRTAYKMTPLHVAAFYGSTSVVKLLLEEVEKIDIDALDFGSWTALHYACNYDWAGCANLLIDHGASFDKKSAELQLVALHLAARSGNVDTVKKLVEKGCDIDQRNLFYTTPLHLACQNDRVKVVDFLLENGAAPDAPDEAGITPTDLTKRFDIVEALEKASMARKKKMRMSPSS